MYPQFPNDPYSYPYYPPNYYPMMPQKPSLLQSMKYSMNKMSMSSTLRTAQKTIYTLNQVIPIINQLRPVLHNASTAFRVVKAVKQFDLDDIDEEIDQNITNNNNTFENMIPNNGSE